MEISILVGKSNHYHFRFEETNKSFLVVGEDLLVALESQYKHKASSSMYKSELKSLHIAISRAIEEGDTLKLGIVIGQAVNKLEQLINE